MQTHNEHATILIVDDQRETCDMLADSLRIAGYHTLTAERGEDALRLAADARPSLIVLAMGLPDMAGVEVCRRLKANPATQPIPVIFITTLTDDEDTMRGFEAGGVDYLTKPFRVAELIARVKTHLLLRQYHQQLQEQHLLLAEKKRRFRTLAETVLSRAGEMTASPEHLQDALDAFEKAFLRQALEQYHWHKGQTAAALGIERKTLYRKMKKFGLS